MNNVQSIVKLFETVSAFILTAAGVGVCTGVIAVIIFAIVVPPAILLAFIDIKFGKRPAQIVGSILAIAFFGWYFGVIASLPGNPKYSSDPKVRATAERLEEESELEFLQSRTSLARGVETVVKDRLES
jgi:hypothetical protein